MSTLHATVSRTAPLALRLSKGRYALHRGFDKLSPNGWGTGADAAPQPPLALSPSKGLCAWHRGFTLIEMLIVMALIALLLTLALPRYFTGLDTAREAVLRENLRTSREAIDKFYGDQGRFPDSLDELVARRYLRSLPLDPVAGGTRGWVLVAPEAPFKGQVSDLRSSAPGAAHDGTAFSTW